MNDGHPIMSIVLFIILLLVNAILNGIRIAIASLSENELEEKSQEGDTFSAKVLDAVRKPDKINRTIDVCVLLLGILAGVFIIIPLSEEAAGRLLMLGGLSASISFVISFVIICIICIFLLYTFGFLLPQLLAVKYSQIWVKGFFGFLQFLIAFLSPLTAGAGAVVRICIMLAGIDPKEIEENVTEEEIITLVSEGHEQGVIEDNEAEMIHNILEFDDKAAGDIMTHRMQVLSIHCDCSISEAARIAAEASFSRFPVYKKDREDIVGIVFLKDIMRTLMSERSGLVVSDIMRDPFFVPESLSIDSLFETMQLKKFHMCMVVDEYGQFCGVVTMEDIIEEIMGNIFDEYDHEENNIQQIGEGYIVMGLTELEEITDIIGIEFDDEFDTLNGFIISQLGHIPQQNEKAEIIYKGYRFAVISVKDNMICMVKVHKISG